MITLKCNDPKGGEECYITISKDKRTRKRPPSNYDRCQVIEILLSV